MFLLSKKMQNAEIYVLWLHFRSVSAYVWAQAGRESTKSMYCWDEKITVLLKTIFLLIYCLHTRITERRRSSALNHKHLPTAGLWSPFVWEDVWAFQEVWPGLAPTGPPCCSVTNLVHEGSAGSWGWGGRVDRAGSDEGKPGGLGGETREGKDPPWEEPETRGESCVVKQAPVLARLRHLHPLHPRPGRALACALTAGSRMEALRRGMTSYVAWVGDAEFFTKFPFWPLNLIYRPSKSIWAAVTESPRHTGFQTIEHLFLTLLEMENPRSKSWQVRCLVRKPLLVHGRLSSRRVLTGPKGQGSAMRSLGHPFDHDGSIFMVLITS